MLQVTAKDNRLHFGDGFAIVFERTLRIPDDGNTYPLPPGLGAFPILKVVDYADKLPEDWKAHGGVFIPMYQREAMWLRFQARHWKPNAAKIAIGKVNAVSGKTWDQSLKQEEKDYLVCPPQPWLDGINAGEDMIRQFVAMPLGMGYTVEAQVTGKEEFGGVQIIVYEPKPGKFPDEPPYREDRYFRMASVAGSTISFGLASAEMGLAAGGKMRQKIYPDTHGIDTWDQDNYGRVYVHIVNSMMFREITGKEPPTTPVTAKTYAQYKLPWFNLYDDHMDDIQAPETLEQVKSVKEMDEQKGFEPQQDDSPVNVPDDLIVKYKVKTDDVKDGEW